MLQENKIGIYRLVGLNRNHNDEIICARIEPLGKEELFSASIDMSKKNKEGLWDYLEMYWNKYHPTCEVSYTGDYYNPKDCLILKVNINECEEQE